MPLLVCYSFSDGTTLILVNSTYSFGFGGTNSHCILEEYVPERRTNGISSTIGPPSSLLFTPLTFSAASSTALRAMLLQYVEYLESNRDTVSIKDLAYTLQDRRSTFPYRKAIAAPTVPDAIQSLRRLVKLPPEDKEATELDTRFITTAGGPKKILGIFTGQGAQWPRMGAQLIECSAFAASRLAELDANLQGLDDISSRPTWTIQEQLLASADCSRLAEAELSQPLCTAVQIILVDILRAAGIMFAAVVGHSSGEIGAAYAAGLLSARDAILIAYFRGKYAKLASSPRDHSPRGAMMAVGMSFDDAWSLCEESFAGRIQVAAVNSSSSVTLSGDEDAINEAEEVLNVQGTFARKLKVDTAYHSAHMTPCAEPYLASLEACQVVFTQPQDDSAPVWLSSVFEGKRMSQASMTNQYWVDNMCNTVMFAGAVSHALKHVGSFDLAVEIGPHPALKSPATTMMELDMPDTNVPYTGLLSRGKGDIEQLSAALGFIWMRMGSGGVQFGTVEALMSGTRSKRVLSDLPPYPFDHQRSYWTSSRLANHFKGSAKQAPNPILGTPCAESSTPGEMQWRNILGQSEISWLKGHMLQGQTVFPATGYVCMAVEATKALVFASSTHPTSMGQIRLTDVEISRPIVFDDEGASVETIFSASSISTCGSIITAEWACYSVADGGNNIVLNAKGRTSVELFLAHPDSLSSLKTEEAFNLVKIGNDQFYSNLSRIGYGYSPPFQGVSNIQRKLGYSIGALSDQSDSAWEDGLVIHPGMLDSALQTIFAAWSFPGDTQLRSLHVPVSISAITINPYFTALGDGGKQSDLGYETSIRNRKHSAVLGDIYLYTESGSHGFVQLEGVTLVPISPTTRADDLPMFSHFRYNVASPDGQLAAAGETLSAHDIQMYSDIDRVSYWFIRNASLTIPKEERQNLLPHFQKYLQWCDGMVNLVSQSKHPRVAAQCGLDTREHINQILARYQGRKDVRFVEVVGNSLIDVLWSGSSMLEHMYQDGLLRAFYEADALCAGPASRWLSRIVSQISHRFSSLNIFEIGAGTGATTSMVLRELNGAYASYMFTDISSGFFQSAEEEFGESAHRMTFKTFDMEKDAKAQGFSEGFYDVLLAMNVLHVSVDIEATISNIRGLLKPGGYLIVGELTSTDLLFTGMTVGTLPGWWIGAETGRPSGPLLSLDKWDAVLRKTGFAGIDTVTPDISTSLPISVFVAQAVDDRITLLREPLSVTKHPVDVRTDKLAIIGGTTLPVLELAQRVNDIISYRFQVKGLFRTVEEFTSSALAKSASDSGPVSIVCLTDLDSPFMESFTADKFSALQNLWSASGTMLWVTQGSKEANPYCNMITGLAHTVKKEYPNLSVQTFDLKFEDQGCPSNRDTALDLAETLLRQAALYSWGEDTDAMLWTAEPQIFEKNGKHFISRLLVDLEKNTRYNCTRRDIFTATSTATETLQLVGTGEARDYRQEIQKPSPLSISTSPGTAHRNIRVTHSLLQSIYIENIGFLRLCIGTDTISGDSVMAFSGSNASPANIPEEWCFPLFHMDPISALSRVACSIIAENILVLVPKGGTLLMNEADRALQLAILARAKAREVHVVFTTADLRRSKASNTILLRPGSPRRVVQSMIPACTAIFVHFSRGVASDALRDEILKCLPTMCIKVGEETLLGHEVSLISNSKASVRLGGRLKFALSDIHQNDATKIDCIALQDVCQHTAIREPLALVHWDATTSITAKVQPVDSGTLFRSDRTYLFVGMAGELGQSLAKWMAAHGARYVILTSRNPKVNTRFVDAMKIRYGAMVRTLPLDITSRKSLSSAHATITANLPPIAGVINGAMILHDEMFTNMTFEQFTRVSEPKVVGTRLLDELFHDDTSLEFFIVASSISSVINWGGQSNYIAANDFMTGLVHQRRRRGVAGSVIHIPAVLGVGSAANAGAFDFDYFQSLGHFNISEEDLHVLFAEAMLSGHPRKGSEVSAEVAMGIDFQPPGLVVREAHRRDLKFNHFVLREERVTKTNATKSRERVKVQLETVNSPEEASAVIWQAFLTHLKRMLQMSEEDKVDNSGNLADLGVDSLIAVDIRAWFLKELDVDMPTLKILGGGSITELLETAIGKRELKSS